MRRHILLLYKNTLKLENVKDIVYVLFMYISVYIDILRGWIERGRRNDNKTNLRDVRAMPNNTG